MTAITARVTVTVRVVLIFGARCCLLPFLRGLRGLVGAGNKLLPEREDGHEAGDLVDLHPVGGIAERRVKDLLK